MVKFFTNSNQTPGLSGNGSFFILKIIDQKYFDQTLIEFNPTQIPNNHLQYAGTWFLLFIVIGILYFYQLYQIIRVKWNT